MAFFLADKANTRRVKGRGTTQNPSARFLQEEREVFYDGWQTEISEESKLKTHVTIEHPKSIITRNHSPDLPFDRSINPYRGCEHGCIYCFARPTHAYMDLSAGVDFESQLFAKPNAANLLRKELRQRNYVCRPIALGTNTDPYQPIERHHKITRQVIELLADCNHPFTITTKSDLVLRDLDILQPLAGRNLNCVSISLTSLDNRLSRIMEPRASAPHKRLNAIKKLSNAGVRVIVQLAPIIPAINDQEIEDLLHAAKEHGASQATMLPLRLPYEVAGLFEEWVGVHFPDRANKIMKFVREMRDGKANDPNFHSRMSAKGPYAEIARARFNKTSKNLGFKGRKYELATDLFVPPEGDANQLALFGNHPS